MIINSLPPTSKQPLVVRPFRPLAQTMTELPGLLGGKGKQRESTSDLDFALLEGLLVASSLLEGRQSLHSYIILVSAQDIPITNFWDEELPGTLPLAVAWPQIGPSTALEKQHSTSSQGWQRLIQDIAKSQAHFCTITTRFLPRLEDLQRKVAAAGNRPSQALPNLQHPEHAILLTGFQSAHSKRSHSTSISESPRDTKEGVVESMPSGQHKRVKLSPNAEVRKPLPEQKPMKKAKIETIQQAQEASSTARPPMQLTQIAPDLSYLQQSPTKMLMSLANADGSGPNAVDASAVFQPQQQQIQELAQQPFSVQDIQQKREEVKTQMKQFLTSLSSMAKAKQFSMDQARAAAEQVRAEAVKKLQLLDRLEQQQSLNRSPSLGAFGTPSNPEIGLQQSPAAALQQLQHMIQQNSQGSGHSAAQSQQQSLTQGSAQMQHSQQNPAQVQQQQQSVPHQSHNQHQQFVHDQRHQSSMPPDPAFLGHQRTASFSSATSSGAQQPTPNAPFVQQQGLLSTTPTLAAQTPQASTRALPAKAQPASPNRSSPVWSGPIQWSLVDPQTKQKRELAFYVDAVPMRSNATVELVNLQWPAVLEIAHISGMPMSDLQKYASDNRIQVIQLQKASPTVVEQKGMSQGQNDSLYKLLAKSLEDKSSVATIKLPAIGQNRGIVVVALPGQGKLVGLLFLHANLPARTSSGTNESSQQSMQKGPHRTPGYSSQPLPSPSLVQQNLEPLLQQQWSTQVQSQQGQHQSGSSSLYAPGIGLQSQQDFFSPTMQGNVPLPQGRPLIRRNSSNQSTLPVQTNNQTQQMSDAQFQELLASIQR